jgi:ribosomal protein L7/L12
MDLTKDTLYVLANICSQNGKSDAMTVFNSLPLNLQEDVLGMALKAVEFQASQANKNSGPKLTVGFPMSNGTEVFISGHVPADKKIAFIKAIRAAVNIDLREGKDWCEQYMAMSKPQADVFVDYNRLVSNNISYYEWIEMLENIGLNIAE